jgi:hypothetical protein
MLGVRFFDPHLPRMLATRRPMDIFSRSLRPGILTWRLMHWLADNDPDLQPHQRENWRDQA